MAASAISIPPVINKLDSTQIQHGIPFTVNFSINAKIASMDTNMRKFYILIINEARHNVKMQKLEIRLSILQYWCRSTFISTVMAEHRGARSVYKQTRKNTEACIHTIIAEGIKYTISKSILNSNTKRERRSTS